MFTEYVLINYGIVISAIAISVISFFTILRGRQKQRYLLMLGAVVANLLRAIACLVTIVLETNSAASRIPAALTIYQIATMLKYLLVYVISCFFWLYIIESLKEKTNVHNSDKVLIILLCLYTALLFCNMKFGILFSVTGIGQIVRGQGAFLDILFTVGIVLLIFDYMHRFREFLSREEITFYILTSFLCLGGWLSLINRAIYWGQMFLAIANFLVIFYVHAMGFLRYYEDSRLVTETEYSLLVSQLRPHFLYNVLSSISQLCKKDPDKAIEMTERFSDYLETNLKEMRKCELISFEQELKHLKDYIAIEQIRFGEDMKVFFAIETVDFMVPSMAIQPVIENAIKHGIGAREEGGKILMNVHKYNGGVCVVIHDDGVGFDTSKQGQDPDRPSGIGNAIKRLKMIPGASLMTHSVVGEGTTVTIMLPDTGIVEGGKE